MNIISIPRLITICLLTITTSGIIWAQDTTDRSITSKAFDESRPSRRGKGHVTSKAKPRSYKYVRSDNNVVHRNPSHKPPKPVTTEAVKTITRIGVTLWKAREPVGNEPGYYFTSTDDKGKIQKLLAERVGIDTVFKPQDRLRFGVESNTPGYLYVIGRETYNDGTFGRPYAIFPNPESPDDDNTVFPGMLFDYPDQRDETPFLTLDPQKPTYSGEILTLIISPKPLTIMKLDRDNLHLIDSDDLTDLEFGTDVEVFSRIDNDDKIYTKVESASACGAAAREKTARDLVLKKPAGHPCGTTSGQLYNDDPHPQTMYHVKVTPGQPAVAFIKLTVH